MVVTLKLDFILKLSFQVNDLKTQIRGIINDNEEMKLNQVKTKLNQLSIYFLRLLKVEKYQAFWKIKPNTSKKN